MAASKSVYLAGPISGLTHDQSRYGWRARFVELLAGVKHIHCFSPMRAKGFLADLGVLSSDATTYPDNAIASPAGIVTRDYNDVKTCDAMVACFLESGGRPSLGTAVEYGYCWSHQKPIIAVGPPDDVNIRHAMLHRMAGYHVETLEEAVHIIVHLLTPGL